MAESEQEAGVLARLTRERYDTVVLELIHRDDAQSEVVLSVAWTSNAHGVVAQGTTSVSSND